MGATRDPWEHLADALLEREALRVRSGLGIAPRDYAGVFVDHADVDRILRTLPGLDGPDASEAAEQLAELEPQIEAARISFEASLEGPGRFAQICRRAGLGSEEAAILALVVAVEMAPARQRLVAYVQDSIHLPRLTLGTMRRIVPWRNAGVAAVGPQSRLTSAGYVEVTDSGPWSNHVISPAAALVWFLAAGPDSGSDLPVGARLEPSTDRPPVEPQLLLVTGADRSSRIAKVQAHIEGPVVVTPAPTSAEDWDALVRGATLHGAFILLEVTEPLRHAAQAVIERAEHLTWAISSPHELALHAIPRRPWTEIHVTDGDASDADWERLFGDGASNGHHLDREQLRLAATAYRGDVAAAVRRLAGGQLDSLALRVPPRRSWEDVILPDEPLTQLRELTARYRHRGRVFDEWGFKAVPSSGLVALFSGQSGTGKTLSAEVIAGDLGIDLYKIDLSSVVSKYIGETEKHLERLFGAASAGNVVLFFDEADALFGKRSEVGDAHDRYANIETSYLLQRLETYDGLVILATNLAGNMDDAFQRRIHVAVDFPMPEVDERRAIWELSFPAAAPLEDIDTGFLAAQFKISGGSIRNAALWAAFLAADADVPITMDLIIRGLKREFQKLGRLRTEEEFGRYFHLVQGRPRTARA